MNRTKKIYFLSAIVMIIGCYALNLSYSLFVQTEEKEVVTSTIPTLSSTLSIPNVFIEANEEYLIKQTVTNTGTSAINYGLIANSNGNFEVKLLDKEGNFSYGTLASNSSNDIYLYVANKSEENITINFTLDTNYSTLNYDLEVLLKNSHIDTINKYTITYNEIPYSNKPESLAYKIINQYITSGLYKGTKTSPTLDEILMNNKVSLPVNNKLNIETPDFSKPATTELGLFEMNDDYGISYYYRGITDKNYVSFANQLWRIVRINGDGSIRLILDTSIGETQYNTLNNDNAYLGYAYGEPNSDDYDTTHKFNLDKKQSNSTIKSSLDRWFENNLTNYQNSISDTLFCGDKTISKKELGYGKNNTNYGINEKITLECAKNTDNDYSRYTVENNLTSNGKLTNGYLTYPIALLSKEELIVAGASEKETNNYFYLNSDYSWWTMSPSKFENDIANVFVNNNLTGLTSADVSTTNGVRPVINLKINTVVTSGDGTKTNPFVIQ